MACIIRPAAAIRRGGRILTGKRKGDETGKKEKGSFFHLGAG
jgi:hypothetical protein